MTPDNWYFYLSYASTATLLIPILLGILNVVKLNISFRILLIGLIISFILSLLMIYVGVILKKNNLFLFIIDSINSCLFFTGFYYKMIFNKQLIKILWGISFLISLFLIYNLFEQLKGVNSQFSIIFESLFTVTISIFLLSKVLLLTKPNEVIRDNPFFWICMAKIIPTIVNLLLTGYADNLSYENPSLFIALFKINSIISILGNFAFGVGFWKSLSFDFKTFYSN